jgi:prepilin-type N-terminal cleavage/methylation domain-containing protein
MKNRWDRLPSTGFTLVELLVVLAISVALAAVTLPTVKTLLRDRKINQTALQVRSFIELARARAIGEQRPMAVIMYRYDRDLGGPRGTPENEIRDRNTCRELAIAEVLPAYRGDTDNSFVTLDIDPAGLGYVDVAVLNVAANPTADFNIQAGDTISFQGVPLEFLIQEKIYDAVNDQLRIKFQNPPFGPEFVAASTSYTGLQYVGNKPAINLPSTRTNPPPLKFNVTPKPRRMFSSPLTLPKGTCIDLSLSGIGNGGNQFITLNPLDTAPVYLIFGTHGELTSIIRNPTATPNLLRQTVPSDNMFLHVGRVDQVDTPSAAVVPPYVSDVAVSQRDSFRTNFYDPSNFWIRLAPLTGGVSTSVSRDAEKGTVELAATLGRPPTFPELLQGVRSDAIFSTEASLE